MNEHDVERALRDWIEEDTAVPEPSRLRERVLAVPETAEVGARFHWPWLTGWLGARPLSAATAAAVALALLALVLVPLGPTKEPGTLVVAQDGSGEYGTISDAVAAAEDGDTILVRPATYVESIRIDKDITLRGDGDREDVVITSPSEPVRRYLPRDQEPYAIRVDGADASVEDLTLTGPTSAMIVLGGSQRITNVTFGDIGYFDDVDSEGESHYAGLILADGSSATVRDSLFQEGSVIVDPGARITLEDNELEGSWVGIGHGRMGVRAMTPVDPADIAAEGSDFEGTVISRNVWTDSQDAVFVGFGETALIEDNEIRGSDEVAIMVMSANDGSVIRGNTITDGRTAIMLVDDTGVDVSENVLSGNQVGINISGRGATVSRNEIRDNTVGVIIASVSYGTSPTLEGNDISGNVRGVSISAGASPILRDNVICGNELNLNLVEGARAIFEDNEICPDGASSEAP